VHLQRIIKERAGGRDGTLVRSSHPGTAKSFVVPPLGGRSGPKPAEAGTTNRLCRPPDLTTETRRARRSHQDQALWQFSKKTIFQGVPKRLDNNLRNLLSLCSPHLWCNFRHKNRTRSSATFRHSSRGWRRGVVYMFPHIFVKSFFRPVEEFL
jgi:hypothetical protein